MLILLILFILLVVLCIVTSIASHKIDITYARLKNRPSNVKMNYSDIKLAEFKMGDKGKVFDTNEVTKVVHGVPCKYFKVVFENGKTILVDVACIKWISYIEDNNENLIKSNTVKI